MKRKNFLNPESTTFTVVTVLSIVAATFTGKILMRKWALICLLVTFFFSVLQASGINSPYSKKELLQELIRLNDKSIPERLTRNYTTKENQYYGAVFDGDSVVSPNGTAHFIQTLICSYVSPESKFYTSDELLRRMTLAARALLKLQHEDGTIDLLSTNFHSTPDLGFTIYPVAMAYSIMLQNNKLNFNELASLLKTYMLNAGEALSVGGIHTPNHRWVISGALAWINSFFPNPKYKTRVEQWLAEKIDIDPDGQYRERSTSVYTPVTNKSLIDIAQKMGYDSIYNVIRKNLDMTFYYIRSNGEIATESSRRQDKYQRSNMSNYYLAYNYMAIWDNDSRYAGMVNYIENTVPIEQLGYMLPHFLENADLLKDLSAGEPLPTRTQKEESCNLVRFCSQCLL